MHEMEQSCTLVFIPPPQMPLVGGVFNRHFQKYTNSGQRFGLIRGKRGPRNGAGGGGGGLRMGGECGVWVANVVYWSLLIFLGGGAEPVMVTV